MPITEQLALEIERCGFFPELLRRLVNEAVAGAVLYDFLMQAETALDFEHLHRHATILCLLDEVLAIVHVDEQDGRATASIEYIRLSDIRTIGVTYGISDPSADDGGTMDELTLQMSWDAVTRSDTEAASCGDPQCRGDHGYTTTTIPDDLVIRVSGTVEGMQALEMACHFVATLRSRLYPFNKTGA